MAQTHNFILERVKLGLVITVCGLKLQEECCEQWVSDASELLGMLLCDIASLSRLSITSFDGLYALNPFESFRTKPLNAGIIP